MLFDLYSFLNVLSVAISKKQKHLFGHHFTSTLDIDYSYPIPNQLGFQDPISPIMDGIIEFHNHIMFFVVLVVIMVTYLLYSAISQFGCNFENLQDPLFAKTKNIFKSVSKFSHAPMLEIVWTLFPTIVLMVIAVPSFALLYAMDINVSAPYTLTVTGHQWYWSYTDRTDLVEMPEFNSKGTYDDGSLKNYDLILENPFMSNLRLLKVENQMFLPVGEHIRLIIGSDDVIHSFAVPSLGIKIDAVPGRINQGFIFARADSQCYGQCSEICGINHGFMPISLYFGPSEELGLYFKHLDYEYPEYDHRYFVYSVFKSRRAAFQALK